VQIFLECKDLEIRYGLRKVVDGLSFSLKNEEALAIIGKNGAGKTSTLKALIGYLPFRKGSIQLLGLKPGDWRGFKDLGFAPESGAPPDYLRASEYLIFLSKLKGFSSSQAKMISEELISVFELDPQKKIRECSKGMKRRLVLAQAFVGRPRIVILDEPLNGLDPLMIIKLREWLIQYRKQGASLIYSSHILSEVEKCCDRVLILNEGQSLLCDSIEQVRAQFGSIEEAFYKKVGHP